MKAKLNTMIQAFINARIGVAHRLLVAQGQQAEAETYEKRLAICA